MGQPLSVKVDATASIKLQHREAVPERVKLAGRLQLLESKQQLRERVGEGLWQKLLGMCMKTASDSQRGRGGAVGILAEAASHAHANSQRQPAGQVGLLGLRFSGLGPDNMLAACGMLPRPPTHLHSALLPHPHWWASCQRLQADALQGGTGHGGV